MLTQDQVRRRFKRVTRRLGWRNLKVGDVLCGVEKAMGLKAGEKIGVSGFECVFCSMMGGLTCKRKTGFRCCFPGDAALPLNRILLWEKMHEAL